MWKKIVAFFKRGQRLLAADIKVAIEKDTPAINAALAKLEPVAQKALDDAIQIMLNDIAAAIEARLG